MINREYSCAGQSRAEAMLEANKFDGSNHCAAATVSH